MPTGMSNSIMLGSNATATGSGQFVIGDAANPVSDTYFGGVYHSTADTAGLAHVLHGMGGNGTNKAGGNLTIAAGRGTGSAAGGSIIFQSSAAGGSGTGENALATIGSISNVGVLSMNAMQVLNDKLTAGTMTAETEAKIRTVTSSYTWTTAQVNTALGAGTAGDITVATLPAKTQVVDAMAVITEAATGPATLTVACGRTGATYIDYIVASDAKAAANTVYGDASVERGTNLVGYDLPSYTGTTDVKCHFVAGDTTDLTTGRGRVIITTRLLP